MKAMIALALGVSLAGSALAQPKLEQRWGFQSMHGFELQDPTKNYSDTNKQIASYYAYSSVRDMGEVDTYTAAGGTSASFCRGFVAKYGQEFLKRRNVACYGQYWRMFATKAEADAAFIETLTKFRNSHGPKEEMLFDDFKIVGGTTRYIKLK